MRAIEGGNVGEVLPDSAVSERPSGSYAVIGNADTVSGWPTLVPLSLGLIAERQRLVRKGDHPIEFAGADAALEASFLEQRTKTKRRITVVAHTGKLGARLAWKLVLDAGGRRRTLSADRLTRRE